MTVNALQELKEPWERIFCISNPCRLSALHLAVISPKPAEILASVSALGLDLKTLDIHGNSAYETANIRGSHEALEKLLHMEYDQGIGLKFGIFKKM